MDLKVDGMAKNLSPGWHRVDDALFLPRPPPPFVNRMSTARENVVTQPSAVPGEERGIRVATAGNGKYSDARWAFSKR
jgi:hypothetical protein